MLEPVFLKSSSFDARLILDNKVSAVIFRNFYSESDCVKLISRLRDFNLLLKKSSNYVGPFLMNYITQKQTYFARSKSAIKKFNKIFSDLNNPITQIHKTLANLFSNYYYWAPTEGNQPYSPCIIRIHPKGSKIPLHKDKVRYEGVNYNISNIDFQLSCVLHLQESEKGGNLKIYDKSWKRTDEKFRDIEFGYLSEVVKGTDYCIIEPKMGDLVIINSTNFHEVLPILGNTPRISLGMFVGLKTRGRQMITWA